jgi:hypothetical protein
VSLRQSSTHLETEANWSVHRFRLSQVQLRPVEKSKCFVRVPIHRPKVQRARGAHLAENQVAVAFTRHAVEAPPLVPKVIAIPA